MKAITITFSICALTFGGCGKKSGSNGNSSAGNGSSTSFIDTSTIESKVELTPTSQISLTSLTGFALSNGTVSAIRSASTAQPIAGMGSVEKILQNERAHFFVFLPTSDQKCVIGVFIQSNGNYFCVPRLESTKASGEIISSPSGNFILFYASNAAACPTEVPYCAYDRSIYLIDLRNEKLTVTQFKPKSYILNDEFFHTGHIPDDSGNILGVSTNIYNSRLLFRRADKTIFLGDPIFKDNITEKSCFAFQQNGDLLWWSTSKNALIKAPNSQLTGESNNQLIEFPSDITLSRCDKIVASNKFAYLEALIGPPETAKRGIVQVDLETKNYKSTIPLDSFGLFSDIPKYRIFNEFLLIETSSMNTASSLFAMAPTDLSFSRIDEGTSYRNSSITENIILMLTNEKILSYDPKTGNSFWESFPDVNFNNYSIFSAFRNAKFCTPGSAGPSIDCKSAFPHSLTASYTFTCNADGQTRTKSSCTLTACNAGYEISNGQCQAIVP